MAACAKVMRARNLCNTGDSMTLQGAADAGLTSRMVSSWLALYWAITLFRVSCSQAHCTNSQDSLEMVRLLKLVALSMHTHRKCQRENIIGQHA